MNKTWIADKNLTIEIPEIPIKNTDNRNKKIRLVARWSLKENNRLCCQWITE